MKALGIDFGERRIGLAISDPEGRIALPKDGLERSTDRRAVYAIAELARRESVAVLVVGEPRTLDGGEHAAGERIRRFGRKLERATQLPLIYVEETLTTVEAGARLAAVGLDDGRRGRGRRDAVAAQILLQEALDRGLAGRAATAAEEVSSCES